MTKTKITPLYERLNRDNELFVRKLYVNGEEAGVRYAK